MTRLTAPDGGRIHVVERGSGRPLVLVHGMTMSSGIWSRQLAELSDRYRVVALDLRGHGRSAAGRDGFQIEAVAGDIAVALEGLDLEDAIVVGHSMGSMALIQFCASFAPARSRRVAGLVFLSASPGVVVPGGVRWVSERIAARTGRVRLPWHGSFLTGFGLLSLDARAALAGVDTPAVIVVGRRDRLTPIARAERLAAMMPHARVEVVDGAGHQVMLDQPAALAAVLDRFSAEL